jgi:hypothetical protein
MNVTIFLSTILVSFGLACQAQTFDLPSDMNIPVVTVQEWGILLKFAASAKPTKLSDTIRKQAVLMTQQQVRDLAALKKLKGGKSTAEEDSAMGRSLVINSLMLWYADEVHPPTKSKQERELLQARRLDMLGVFESLRKDYEPTLVSSWANMMTATRAYGFPSATLPW